MKVLSLFSGIGAFEKALDRLEIGYELVGFSEIDKYAVRSYCAIHGADEALNLGDITKVNEIYLPKADLITYGFPCQDISLAGKRKGMFNEDGTQTRSGLFFEALRIIEAVQPKVAIAENVKNLTGKRFKEQFALVLNGLEEAGYNNYWQVLNAKDYGIPQNRERVFIISIRKDVDNGMFQFPAGFPLKLRLKDLIDENVDEKYYLSGDGVARILNSEFKHGLARVQDGDDASQTLLARDYKDPKCVQVGQIYGTEREPNPQAGRVYDASGIAPTMDSCSGGNRMPKVVEPVKVGNTTPSGRSQCNDVYSSDYIHPTLCAGTHENCNSSVLVSESPQQAVAVAMRGRYAEDGTVEQNIEVSDREYANALTTVQKDSMVSDSLRIRKLTPKECFRLMGFDDEDFEKAAEVNSNTQLYKQAGNSIVVNVLEAIFRELQKTGALEEPKKRRWWDVFHR